MRQFEVSGSRGWHGEVNTNKTGGEDEENGNGDGEFPCVEWESLRFRFFGSRGIIFQLHAALFVF